MTLSRVIGAPIFTLTFLILFYYKNYCSSNICLTSNLCPLFKVNLTSFVSKQKGKRMRLIIASIVAILLLSLIKVNCTNAVECLSDFDCTLPTDTLCSKTLCLNGTCTKSTSNIANPECCVDSDCKSDSDICKQTTCTGGVFVDGVLTQSPICQTTPKCCIQTNWNNYCKWPGEVSSWNKTACVGTRCDVVTWGTIYSYPFNNSVPNLPSFQPRYYFRLAWATLFKKFITVSLNVEANYGLQPSTVEVPEIRPDLSTELQNIEDFLLSACDVWKKALSTCAPPPGVSPSNFTNFEDFQNDPRYSVYDTYLSTILQGENVTLSLC